MQRVHNIKRLARRWKPLSLPGQWHRYSRGCCGITGAGNLPSFETVLYHITLLYYLWTCKRCLLSQIFPSRSFTQRNMIVQSHERFFRIIGISLICLLHCNSNNNRAPVDFVGQWVEYPLGIQTVDWPLWDVAVILKVFFSTTLFRLVASVWNCSQLYTTNPYQWEVNIGSGNGFVLSGNKPLAEWCVSKLGKHWFR